MMRGTNVRKVLDGRRIFTWAVAVLAILASGATAAFAQDQADRPPTAERPSMETGRGFYLGLLLAGSSLHVDESDEELFFVKNNGGGVQIRAGYGFNSVFSLEFSLGVTRHDTSAPNISAGLGLAQIFALYRFAPRSAFRPYIKGGFGGYGLTLDWGDLEARTNGGGVAFGGGFDYFFSRHFCLGVDFTHNIIAYDKLELQFGGATFGSEIDEGGAMSSLGLTLAYFF